MNFLAFELLEHYCCVRGMNCQGVVCGVYDGRLSGDRHRWGRAQHCAPMRPDIALNRSSLRGARLLFAAPPVCSCRHLARSRCHCWMVWSSQQRRRPSLWLSRHAARDRRFDCYCVIGTLHRSERAAATARFRRELQTRLSRPNSGVARISRQKA